VPDYSDPGAGAYPSARCRGSTRKTTTRQGGGGGRRRRPRPQTTTVETTLAGLGIIGLRLGTIRRRDGRLQVTFAGFALYRCSGDTRPGDAKGQGSGKVWIAFGPSGRLVGA
jgi:hypothetical protein